MSFQIVRSSMTSIHADAIVSTTSPKAAIGPGVDQTIYKAAGSMQLLAAKRKIGEMIPGQAAITPALKLSARYVIHTVVPVWQGGGRGELTILRACYENALYLAKEQGCKSIAFPLLATGDFGFPGDQAVETARQIISRFLLRHDMEVTLVVSDRQSFALPGRVLGELNSFLSTHEVRQISPAKNRWAAWEAEECITQTLYPSAEQPEKPKKSKRRWGYQKAEQEPQETQYDARDVDCGVTVSFGGPSMPMEVSQAPQDLLAMSDACGYEDPQDQVRSKASSNPQASMDASASSRPYASAGAPAPARSQAPVEMQSLMRTQGPPVGYAPPRPQAHGQPYAQPQPFIQTPRSLDDVVIQLGESFQQRLLRMIDERHLTDVDVYKRANLDRKLFSKIRCNPDYRPKKKTALALAIAIKLNLDETKDLLSRAELALSPSSRFDLIIQYFIQKEIFDIYTINMALFKYDQPMLGE